MMSRTTLFIALLALGCTEPARTVQFQLAPQSHRYHQSLRLQIEGGGASINIDQLQLNDTIFRWEMGAPVDGRAPVSVRYEAARVRMLDRDEGTEWTVDTTRPPPAGITQDDRAHLTDRMFRELLGTGYRYQLDRRGRMTTFARDGLAAGEVREWMGPLPAEDPGSGGTWAWAGVEDVGLLEGVRVRVEGRVGERSAVHGRPCTELHITRSFTVADPTLATELHPDRGVLCMGDDGRPLRQSFTFRKVTHAAGFPMEAHGSVETVWVPPDQEPRWTVEPGVMVPRPSPATGGVDRGGDALPAGALTRLGTERAVAGAAKAPDGRAGATVPFGDGHRAALVDTAVSPDGARLAAIHHDGAVRVWALADGAPGPQWQIPPAPGGSTTPFVGWLADGTLLAGGVAGGFRLRPDGGQAEDPGWERPERFITSGDGRRAVSIEQHGGRLDAWATDGPTRRRLWQISGARGLSGARPCDTWLSADGVLALVGFEGTDQVELRRMDTGAVLRTETTDDCLGALSGDGRRLAVVGRSSNHVRVLDARTGAEIATIVRPKTTLIFGFSGLALDATGRRLAVAHRGQVGLFDLDALRPPEQHGAHPPPNRLFDGLGEQFMINPRFVGDRLLTAAQTGASVLVLDAALP